jgi:hypothetical protein
MAAVVAIALLAGLVAAGHGAPAHPVECNVLAGERGANVWERAKIPQLRRYCALVASASAKLTPGSRMVGDVVRLADEAEALVPGRAAPMVLKGRALCQLARHAEAKVSLRLARERDAHALDDPATLFAWARVLASTGDAAGARDAYRDLLPRSDALPLADRGVAYVGSGVLALQAGPAAIGNAVAILRQARHDSQDVLRSAATFLLALALDRSGDTGEAATVIAEEGANEAVEVMTDPRVLDAMGKGGEAEARAAVALAREVEGDRAAALTAWQAYVASGACGGVWEAHARSHLAARARTGAPRHPAGHP